MAKENKMQYIRLYAATSSSTSKQSKSTICRNATAVTVYSVIQTWLEP